MEPYHCIGVPHILQRSISQLGAVLGQHFCLHSTPWCSTSWRSGRSGSWERQAWMATTSTPAHHKPGPLAPPAGAPLPLKVCLHAARVRSPGHSVPARRKHITCFASSPPAPPAGAPRPRGALAGAKECGSDWWQTCRGPQTAGSARCQRPRHCTDRARHACTGNLSRLVRLARQHKALWLQEAFKDASQH